MNELLILMNRIPFIIIFILVWGCSNKSNSEDQIKSYTLYVGSTLDTDYVRGRITATIGVYPSDVWMENPIERTYDEGTIVTIQGIPSEEYMFTGWVSSFTGLENPLTITMNSDKIILGSFTLEDEDGDGVNFLDDLCSETPLGETVDENGCSDSQKD